MRSYDNLIPLGFHGKNAVAYVSISDRSNAGAIRNLLDFVGSPVVNLDDKTPDFSYWFHSLHFEWEYRPCNDDWMVKIWGDGGNIWTYLKNNTDDMGIAWEVWLQLMGKTRKLNPQLIFGLMPPMYRIPITSVKGMTVDNRLGQAGICWIGEMALQNGDSLQSVGLPDYQVPWWKAKLKEYRLHFGMSLLDLWKAAFTCNPCELACALEIESLFDSIRALEPYFTQKTECSLAAFHKFEERMKHAYHLAVMTDMLHPHNESQVEEWVGRLRESYSSPTLLYALATKLEAAFASGDFLFASVNARLLRWQRSIFADKFLPK